MPKITPYISIDIETTGLDISHTQILQIAAVYDDGESDVDSLLNFNAFIDDPITYTELNALALHEKSGIFSKIKQYRKIGKAYKLSEALNGFLDFLSVQKEKGNRRRISLAGKNLARFDIPILLKNMSEDQRRRFNEISGIAFIDVGAMYFPDFGRIPSLDEILKFIRKGKGESCNNTEYLLSFIQKYYTTNTKFPSLEEMEKKMEDERISVTHDALDDSIDVIKAIRWKMAN